MPRGFLREFLSLQLDGLTGHIEEAGFPFDSDWWGTDRQTEEGENPGWWVYEQTAYWLDGYIRTGILLGDEAVISRAEKIIRNVLDHPDKDGYLGPKFMKKSDGWERWPHVVFFRACMALYEYDHDGSIIDALTRHYLGESCTHDRKRDVLNVEIMLWLYSVSGDKRLLKLAKSSYEAYNAACDDDLCDSVALSDKKPYCHGVSYNEYSKLGAMLYVYTGERRYLDASVAAYRKTDELFMLPGGCHCSDEFMISNECTESYETCDITDYTWALHYLFEATSDPAYADKIEKCVFNAGIGSVTEDFRALQYFSCANQVIADNTSNHNLFFRGSKWMSYRPNPGTECCPGNVNRFMPNYIMNMWRVKDDEIYAVLYGDSEFTADGVTITETTDYPFTEKFEFAVKTNRKFTLCLRLPSWAMGYKVKLNGEKVTPEILNGFIRLDLTSDCLVSLDFLALVTTKVTPEGVYFERGVLVYSLGQYGLRKIDREEERASAEFPAYNIYANKKWNYGICETAVPKFTPGTARKFDIRLDLPHMTVYAYEAPDWKLVTEHDIKCCENLYKREIFDKTGTFTFTPSPTSATKFSSKRTKITLYPYAACKLRVTVFPIVK